MDYYSVLNLDYKTNPSEDKIKKAYRDLAKTNHPDKGGDEEKFKKISEAYEILSDNEKREEYYDFLKNGGKHEDYDKNNNNNNIPNDLFKMFFGNGGFNMKRNPVPPIIINIKVNLVDFIKGEKKEVKYTRMNADGNNEEKTIRIHLETFEPQIILREKGHQNNPNFKGDVFINFNLEKSDSYDIMNGDLIYKKGINILEAATEVNFNYKHPDGKEIPVKVKNPMKEGYYRIPGIGLITSSNMVINGFMVKKKGDVIIKFEIEEPPKEVIKILKDYFSS